MSTPSSDRRSPRERTDLLERIERYLDTAPRVLADGVDVGPFSVFVSKAPWPYYARPRLGARSAVTCEDVKETERWLRERGLPVAWEWVHESTPSMAGAATDAGLAVHRYPLLVLATPTVPRPVDGVTVRAVAPEADELGSVRAAIDVGFGFAGTGVGPRGAPERDRAGAKLDAQIGTQRALLRSGRSVVVGAFDASAGAIGGGCHGPRGGTTELTGIAVLPAYRRRGVGALITAALIADARAGGAALMFLSASDDDVARVYEGVGFVRIGTSCAADAPTA